MTVEETVMLILLDFTIVDCKVRVDIQMKKWFSHRNYLLKNCLA